VNHVHCPQESYSGLTEHSPRIKQLLPVNTGISELAETIKECSGNFAEEKGVMIEIGLQFLVQYI
jgi:hypothetical protein